MTGTSVHPDVPAVLGQLKDFQRATARYAFDRLYSSDDAVHRFLVADEVGLGKTMVARGVIALAVDRLWDTTERIDVIYICSNSAIARQNINKLNVVPGYEETSLASRITMLPVQARDLARRKLNFVSFTPTTSFDLRSNLGMMDERALLFRLLEKAWGVKGAAPRNALQGKADTDRFRDLIDHAYPSSSVDERIAEHFADALVERAASQRAQGIPDIRTRWESLQGTFRRASERSNRPTYELQLQREVVGELRDILATVCLKSLEPDLIILDEFQRFKHLLDDDSEESRLAQDLFNYTNEHSRARVLLLSATPYKMYTASEEGGEEDHYTDFLATVRFLQADQARTNRCKAVLEDYRRLILRRDAVDKAPLLALKDELERELRRVMVRTERLATTPDRNGMLRYDTRGAKLGVKAEEAVTYRALGRIARSLDQADPVEYWKSAPYVLSFMEEYKLKQAFKACAQLPERAKELASLCSSCSTLALPWSDCEAYGKLDPGNARMRWLLERFVDSGVWRLLWVPPSRPWYRLEGPFADPSIERFTKLLIFSSWNVVPKAIAALTSYAVEREMMVSAGGTPRNSPESRSGSPVLRFGRDSGASLMALIYPSFALARMGADTERDTGDELPSVEELLEVLEGRIKAALRPFPEPSEGREDETWYWAAPALLDLREDKEATLSWFEEPRLQRRATDDDEDEEAESIVADQHIPALRELVGESGEKLGRRPKDLYRRLAQLALAGPAVATLRALTNLYGERVERTDPDLRWRAGQVAYAMRSYFNLHEVTALLRGLEQQADYWKQVLEYCVKGGLGAVLEEYAHVLHDWLGIKGHEQSQVGEQVAEGMIEALTIRTANPVVDDVVLHADGSGFTLEQKRMRSRFAVRLSEDRFEGVKERTRTDTIRKAFNSPFWPFIVASTSVGQEGLDFHLYCHAVAHWNLPSNPVDLEQREGRVHRFKGHAVRKNIARKHAQAAAHVPPCQDPWSAMFEAAAAERPLGSSELWPYWVYPEGDAKIERHVPVLPLSREAARYARLRNAVTMYRMVFGQPRQEDLMEFLMAQMSEEEALKHAATLQLDLSPR